MSDRKFQLNTLSDMRVAKEGYRYEAKLREQLLRTGAEQFGSTLREAAKNTLKDATQRVIYLVVLNLLKKRFK